jgi:hypothetical protein
MPRIDLGESYKELLGIRNRNGRVDGGFCELTCFSCFLFPMVVKKRNIGAVSRMFQM